MNFYRVGNFNTVTRIFFTALENKMDTRAMRFSQKKVCTVRRVGLFLLFCSITNLFAQTQSKRDITVVQKARPIAEAIRQLDDSEHWLISYEDQPYAYPGDLEDLTYAIAAEKHLTVTPNTKHFIGPRQSSVSLTYLRSDPPSLVLSRLLSRYAESNGTVFKVLSANDRLIVVPERVLNSSGKLQEVLPVFSTPINLGLMDRDAGQMLQSICDALSEAAGTRVFVGVAPYFGNTRVKMSAINEPARNVLIRFLEALGKTQIVWTFNAGADGSYALNLRSILQSDVLPVSRAGRGAMVTDPPR